MVLLFETVDLVYTVIRPRRRAGQEKGCVSP